MSELTTTTPGSTALAMTEDEMMVVLENSLYPGAARESIKLVMGYCKAAGLDAMQKPVHIVPMWDSKAKRMRDVIMPGVGLYRTQAARAGCIGVTEPEFGPDITEDIGGTKVTYPKWCRVTAKRKLASGDIAEFTAMEFWKENYATAGKDSIAPNAMWRKRVYGQLAKCAEAQALRKAFPEVGSQPTADEMEGKTIDMGQAEVVQPAQQPLPAPYSDDEFAANLPKWQQVIASGRKTADDLIAFISSKRPLTEQQQQALRATQPAQHQPAAQPQQAEITDAQDHADAPEMTYAQVADRLHKAADMDELANAGSMIALVRDPEHRDGLAKIYDQRAYALQA